MSKFGLEFHHFGLAVPAPEPAFRFLVGLGYQQDKALFDPAQNVHLAMFYHATMPGVEVVWPVDQTSPIHRMTSRRGELVYHLCFTASDAATALRDLQEAGHDVLHVTAPSPAPLFNGLPVSFHLIRGVGLIELIHGTPLRHECA